MFTGNQRLVSNLQNEWLFIIFHSKTHKTKRKEVALEYKLNVFIVCKISFQPYLQFQCRIPCHSSPLIVCHRYPYYRKCCVLHMKYYFLRGLLLFHGKYEGIK